MKTYNNLYPKITDAHNLVLAWYNARRGKRYRPAVAHYLRHLDVELVTLRHQLLNETWLPSSYATFLVHETKPRKISAAPFRDRVVHHGLCNIIESIYERKFIFDSYANRKGKGTHKALDRCTHYMRRYKYVLQCDIQQFFPAIDHEILKSILAKTITCQSTLMLCNKVIDSGVGILSDQYTMRYFPQDDLFALHRHRGLPIGNLTSQFWANVYLNELDQFVKHQLRCKGYLRYVDDFLLFANDKATLHQWRHEIIAFLQTLRLTIHENRAQVKPVTQGIPFLGFTVFPTHRRLQRTKGLAYRCRLRAKYYTLQQQKLTRSDLANSVTAWLGHIQHGDTFSLQHAIMEYVFK